MVSAPRLLPAARLHWQGQQDASSGFCPSLFLQAPPGGSVSEPHKHKPSAYTYRRGWNSHHPGGGRQSSSEHGFQRPAAEG